ncbi:DnaJ domain-containing protein [Desulfobacula toluolica]|uniref:Predicted heat shock protein, DnaJ domain n=1 Tax=Desulfobacula toluolica (strain DSM 7467 / Tol2) TaxID=651182 RepID=K0NRM0_DESTT|nr:DnaJ domain-containing protein [Desulfobacula toluolica]CCK81597.1 predicted heat shock protein, DnaJ domain [Desulfobacula toluolica Tol2]
MNSIAFDDYYEDLQISPNADLETIERIYRLLAKRYHPDNKKTGSLDKFNIINKAHQVLSNPEKRAAYDVVYEEKKNHQWQAISQISSHDGYEQDLYNRRCLLSILYIKCRENPSDPGIGLWHLEKMLGWPENVMEFHFWYLKEKSYIRRDENGQLAITVTGVDKIEQDGLVLGKDRLLPESTEENHRLKLIKDDPT